MDLQVFLRKLLTVSLEICVTTHVVSEPVAVIYISIILAIDENHTLNSDIRVDTFHNGAAA